MTGGGVLDPGPDGVPGDCSSCGRAFTVLPGKAGSYVNCPHCGKAVQIEGGRDPLWQGVKVLWLLGCVGIGWFVAVRAGAPVGVLTFSVCLGLGWLVSRAL